MSFKTRNEIDLRGCTPLTREDEHECASEYARTRSPLLESRLITANMKLVAKIAYSYRRPHCDVADLIQEGNLGLIHAVERYDPHRGVKLSSYAAWWIRAYILKFTLDNWRLVKAGTTEPQRRLFFNLSKTRRALEAQGIVADAPHLAAARKLKEKDVVVMLERFANNDTSLDAPRAFHGEDIGSLADTIGDAPALRPDVRLEASDLARTLLIELKTIEVTLEGRDLTLFHRRIMCETPDTLQDIALGFGVTRERARQLEAKLKGRIQIELKRVMGDAVEGRGNRVRRAPLCPVVPIHARAGRVSAVVARIQPAAGRILGALAA